MGNTITRNAFKGYGYQKWVYLNFVYKMDLNNKITYIDAEISRDDSKLRIQGNLKIYTIILVIFNLEHIISAHILTHLYIL